MGFLDTHTMTIAFANEGWFVYRWMSGNDFIWSYYIRDSQGKIVHEDKDLEKVLLNAVREWNYRIKKRDLWQLEKMHTRQLLGLLSRVRFCSYYERPNEDREIPILYENAKWTADDIRLVLNTRPHVPNKEEAREIRQEKAKNQKCDRIKFRNRHHKKPSGASHG